MALRLRRRHELTMPPLFYEPAPYTDRLTLADSFNEDRETRATAEDLRAYHTLMDSFVDVLRSVFRRRSRVRHL